MSGSPDLIPASSHVAGAPAIVERTSGRQPDAQPDGSSWASRPHVRLSALQAAHFSGIGIFMPFMPPWLSSQGLGDKQIGIVLAMGMIIRMLASQPVSSLGDGRLGAVRVLVVIQMLSAAVYLTLPTLGSPQAVMAAMAAVALLAAGIVPLGDHLTTSQVRRQPTLNFARIRLWGSVAFLVTSTASGFAIARFGLGVVPLSLAFCSVAAACAAMGVAEARRDRAAKDAEPAAPADPGQARLLMLVIAGSALINASHGALYGFASLHWRALGIDDGVIGLLWSCSVVAEIILLWRFGGKAWGSWRMALAFLAVAGVAALVRFTAMPYATSLPSLFALQMLHAISFGAQLMGVMAMVAMLAPEGRQARAQGQLSATNAFAMGAATLLSGMIYERAGAQVFHFMLPIAASGLVLVAITYRLARTR